MALSVVSTGPNGQETQHRVSSPQAAVAKYKELEAAGYRRVVIQDDDSRRKHNGKVCEMAFSDSARLSATMPWPAGRPPSA